jgi:hypothetical protein
MWIEHLFNQLGVPLSFGLAVAVLAMPLAIVGGLLRRRGRRERTRWELIDGARTGLRDMAPGRVAVVGSWHPLDGTRGCLQEGDDCAVVERHPEAAAIAEGTRVFVVGYATRQTDSPRGAGFRGKNRVWVVEGDGGGEPVIVSQNPEMPKTALRTARFRSTLGAALLGAAVAVTVGTAALCYRAANDDLATYSD